MELRVVAEDDTGIEDAIGVEQGLDPLHDCVGAIAPFVAHERRHVAAGSVLGALKAEHGSGRNMAPFVRDEWGDRAYAVMQRIKALLDPDGILNPGVVLSDDPQLHLKNLKGLPTISPTADKCIECGFCEP